MRGIKILLMIPAAAVLLLAGACADSNYDDADSGDVLLEIVGYSTPPITAAQSQEGVCSSDPLETCTGDDDCTAGGDTCLFGCTLTVVDWSVNLAAVPKNSLAAGPANDIMMSEVDLTYAGLTPAVDPWTFGLLGLTVPTGGTASATFQPLRLQDLQAGHESTTASLTLTFHGRTVEGTAISTTVTRELPIEVCE